MFMVSQNIKIPNKQESIFSKGFFSKYSFSKMAFSNDEKLVTKCNLYQAASNY